MDHGLLIRNAEYRDHRLDVRIERDRIAAIGPDLPRRAGEEEIDAKGGLLLPGLHDHHLHLLALAASLDSIACGPPTTTNPQALRAALQAAPPNAGWLRGTGYFESVAGPLDRDVLDPLCPDHCLRIQHRSGSMWFLNSRAIDALGLDRRPTPEGVERDTQGRATGRLFRLDAWLGQQLPERKIHDLASVGRLLARHGITSVTDATPTNGESEARLFRDAQEQGQLVQRLLMMGSLDFGEAHSDAELAIGPFKILLDDAALPDLDAVTDSIRRAHARRRAVAIHAVTRGEIHFALAALEAAGTIHGDRLEHASIAPPEAIEMAGRLALTIVTQPHFLAERGDDYLEHVEPQDHPFLYRLQGWLDARVALGGGTDAPFGAPDPWLAMRAAVDRRTPSGAILGPAEALSPERALALFTTAPTEPGGPPRRLTVGAPADLCLLDLPWQDARRALDAERVALTIQRGCIRWRHPTA